MIKLYHFFQSVPVIGHCTSAIQLTQTAKPIVVLLPCLPVINPCDTKKKITELANKIKCSKEMKVIRLEVKFRLNINGIIEETADHGNVNTAFMRDCRSAARGI